MTDLPRDIEALLVLHMDEARSRIVGEVGQHRLGARQEAAVETDEHPHDCLCGRGDVLGVGEIEPDRLLHQHRPWMRQHLAS